MAAIFSITVARAAALSPLQSKQPSRNQDLNSRPLSPLRLAAAAACNQILRVSRDDCSSRLMVAFDHRCCFTSGTKNSGFSVVVRAAEVTAAADGTAAATEVSLGELTRKGDSYFVTDTRPIILFDGVCNMCNGGVNFMLNNDTTGKVRFAALQSEAGKALLARSGRSPDDISSIVLVDKDSSYIKSEAILRIGQQLSFPYPPAASIAFILPLFLRDTVYDTVADNRYSVFGKTDACRLSDPRFAERFIE